MQDELTKSGAQDDKRLVLGFDAGCFTCSDLAARIEERVGDRLAVRNLNDPEVQAWRKEALGEDAKWAPTLFEIEDGKVKAWAGWRMGWALSRAIGPSATWQVMQALGEAGAAPKIEESRIADKLPEKVADTVASLSRGQFIKGVGGALVTVSMLSGVALPAQAASRKPTPYDIVKSRRFFGTELMEAARRAAKTKDIKNVAGTSLSTTAKIRASKPFGLLHTLRNGTTVRAVVYRPSSSRILAHYRYSRSVKLGGTSIAKAWRIEDQKSILVKASEGGHLWRRNPETRAESNGIVPLSECPPVESDPNGGPFGGDCMRRVYDCVCWSQEDSCGWAAAGISWACYQCAKAAMVPGAGAGVAVDCGIGCSIAMAGYIAACCSQRAWVWRPMIGCWGST